MKVLVVCQYYYPEPFRISDICEELSARGHEVQVVTGVPNYPMGKIYDGYRSGQKRDEMYNGVRIHRCFTIGRRHGIIYRLLNYYSYMISSSRYVLNLRERYDVVFVYQLSPVLMANAALKYKKKFGVQVVLYCLDLWPESLLAGDIKRGSVVYKIFHRISEKIYGQADKILLTSRSFERYFEEEFRIKDVMYLPQYAEEVFTPEQCEKKANGSIDLMFAGNVGAAQDIKTIISAAKMTADIPNLRWHIVGDGSELKNLKDMAEGMDSVIFYGRKPLEDMPEYYAMADAMLVTMRPGRVLSMTLPGKVQSYMAAGKPIIGAIDGETARVIEEGRCGFCVPAGDDKGLAEAVRAFCSCEHIDELGKNAERFYQDRFSKERIMEKLENQLRAGAAVR